MANSEPLVCASLHLPLDLQPFLRIHQVAFEVFLPNLDRLRLTLEATRDACPDASQIFFETRKILRQELQEVFRVFNACRSVAEWYLELLEAVSERGPTQNHLREVNGGTLLGIQTATEAQTAMAKFRSELEGAVGRVSTALSAKYKNDSKTSLSSPENTQLVLEIIGGVDECNALLQECQNQFENLRKMTQDKDSIESNPPSADEIQFIRAKWQTLLDNIKDISSHAHKIGLEIQLPGWANSPSASRKHKPAPSVPLWRSFFQRQKKGNVIPSATAPKLLGSSIDTSGAVVTPPTNSNEMRTNESQTNGVDTTEVPESSSNAEAPQAAPSNDPTSTNSKTPFWQKLFRQGSKSAHSTDVSGRPKASDGASDTPFWKKFIRWATCLSTKPISS